MSGGLCSNALYVARYVAASSALRSRISGEGWEGMGSVPPGGHDRYFIDETDLCDLSDGFLVFALGDC
jgi:hypothetical protein